MSRTTTTLPGNTIFGNTKDFAKDTLGFVKRCAEKADHVARAKIAFKDFYILLSPEAIQQVLHDNHKNYKKSFAYKGLSDFLGQGLLTAEGETWLNNRRKLQPVFGQKSMANLVPKMRNTTLQWIDSINQSKGGHLDSQKDFLDLTGAILSGTIFGKSPQQESFVLNKVLTDLRMYANGRMKNPFSLPPNIPTPVNQRFKSSRALLVNHLKSLMSISPDDDPNNILQLMLQDQGDQTMTNQQVLDEIATLYIAGQETTTNALTFALFLLWKHPVEMDKLLEELSEVNLDELDMKEWLALPQLTAVVNETLRLYPPAWAISREAIKEDLVCDHKIPQGSTVFLSIYAMHRHPRFWNAPDKYNPDRFLGTDVPKDAFLPFAKGPRKCIGNYFAQLEMHIVLGYLLKKCRFTLTANPDLELITPMTLNPKKPVKFKLEERPVLPPLSVATSKKATKAMPAALY